jgi:hypothetical protein
MGFIGAMKILGANRRMSWEALLCIALAVLCISLFIEIWWPSFFSKEGFLTSPGDNPFMTGYFPRRGDVSFDNEKDTSYIQERRHVMGYADVQGLGVKHDFCRMLLPKGSKDESGMFFACALGGTENMDSIAYKTMNVGQGFKTSRDDYMRDADKNGKSDYCAVVRMSDPKRWEPQCYRALLTTFDTNQFVDTDPPQDIKDIITFYDGILFWFRFIDDMKDYAENLNIYIGGDLKMDEANVQILPSQLMDGQKDNTTNLDERVQITRGLQFNGVDSFMRLGDSPDLSLGNKIILPTLRAICFWVYFDEFTNNAHILDFGNGAGIDNIFIGVVGRGDPSIEDGAEMRKGACESNDLNNVMPDLPSGAQQPTIMTPQELMKSSANVDECKYISPVEPRNLPPMKPFMNDVSKMVTGPHKRATMIYEVWNGKLRMQHIKVQGAFKRRQWTHVCITTSSSDGVRPGLEIWVDGSKMAENDSAHLPQVAKTTNNYIGKNNWQNDSSTYENRAELFKGSIFDLRAYSKQMTRDKLQKTIKWGRLRLGIKPEPTINGY